MGYTNSPMVVHTKLSPNHSGLRSQNIYIITPHCTAGIMTAESLGSWFAKESTKASSNYGIDKNGRVGMYVEEKNRSWCSSSSWNDNRAVTIEISSEPTAPYAMNEVSYEALIKLCVDICKRYGKKKLLWFNDKGKTLAYEPKADEMVLSIHRWFSNKSCPGDWLMARMYDLSSRVTALLGGVETAAPKETVSQADDEKDIWDNIRGFVGNDYGAAGLMGNLYAESGLKSTNLQNNGNSALGMSDEEFCAAVDGGRYTEEQFVHDGYGFGLAQWTFHTRKKALYDFAKAKGASISDCGMQLDFLRKELEDGYPTVVDALRNAKAVREASDAVLLQFERPADRSVAMQEKRSAYGEQYFKKYAAVEPAPTPAKTQYYRVRKSWEDRDSQIGAMTLFINAKNLADAHPGYRVFDESGKCIYPVDEKPFTPYLVRVHIPNLRIRSGPGIQNAWTGRYTGVGVFTVVGEKPGEGSKQGWGELKSGGYIALDYCEKI